jgi:hypothetical protein
MSCTSDNAVVHQSVNSDYIMMTGSFLCAAVGLLVVGWQSPLKPLRWVLRALAAFSLALVLLLVAHTNILECPTWYESVLMVRRVPSAGDIVKVALFYAITEFVATGIGMPFIGNNELSSRKFRVGACVAVVWSCVAGVVSPRLLAGCVRVAGDTSLFCPSHGGSLAPARRFECLRV